MRPTLDHAIISTAAWCRPGTTIEHSIVGVRSRIGRNVTLRETVLIGADRYETDDERAGNRAAAGSHLTIGDDS